MNLNQFFDATIKNSGASYNITTGELNPISGYFVSLPKYSTKIPFSEFSKDKVKVFINSAIVPLASNEFNFLGSWIEHNTVHLDVSIQIFDKRMAIEFGMLNNQLAIWDANEGKIIDLPTNQTHGTLTQQRAYITSVVNRLCNDTNK